MESVLSKLIFEPEVGRDPALPARPLTRVRYLYGMLLGVDDLEDEQRYHLHAQRIHNALLHGFGTIRGLRVRDRRHEAYDQLHVEPGMAIDPLGRSLYVAQDLCLDLSNIPQELWDSLPEVSQQDCAPQGATRAAYVVARYCASLSDEVPAIAPPCSDSLEESSTWSRIVDSVAIELKAEEPKHLDDLHPRHEPPEDTEHPEAGDGDWLLRNQIHDLGQRELLRTSSSLNKLWEAGKRGDLLLAKIYLRDEDTSDGKSRVRVVRIDNSVRPALRTNQAPLDDRPRVVEVVRNKEDPEALELIISFRGELYPETLDAGMCVRWLVKDKGWVETALFSQVELDSCNRARIKISFPESGESPPLRWRLEIKGTGCTPVYGPAGPFAGRVSDASPALGQGADVAFSEAWNGETTA